MTHRRQVIPHPRSLQSEVKRLAAECVLLVQERRKLEAERKALADERAEIIKFLEEKCNKFQAHWVDRFNNLEAAFEKALAREEASLAREAERIEITERLRRRWHDAADEQRESPAKKWMH
jgi:hypothetical protein